MSALGNFSPAAVTAIKAISYTFRAAPTADLVLWAANTFTAGGTPAQLLNTVFNLPVPMSPFTAYASSSSNTAFCTALVDNLSYTSGISSATKAYWVTELTPVMSAYATRGDFTMLVIGMIDSYNGNDADIVALKTTLAARAESAATFAQSPAGAVYDGQGWGQLLAPLTPPPTPTYALSTSATTLDEGGTATITLTTTNVAAGSSIGYTLTGSGITAGDLVAGVLQGTMTINSAGIGTAVVTLVSDLTTEGTETLRLQLSNGQGQIDITVNDTSITPPPPATYALASNGSARDEGTDVVITLTTTNLAAGTVVNYTLSGSGLTAADITSGVLSGSFIVGAQGTATATIALVADAMTEGAEVLRLTLAGGLGQIDVTVNDTSITPAPVGTPDTVIVSDTMNSNTAHAPGSAAEGEIVLNTYLNYDLLNQAGVDDVRMTVFALKATNPTAGAPPDNTNQSADRANVPQVSNQTLFNFDTGLLTDRIDYSAETGKIVAVISAESPPATQYVLVNDNGTDNTFNNATDRIDTLKNVEEVVASAGGGVLDLTHSETAWQIVFSRNFTAGTDINATTDRATHRIELSNLLTGVPYGRSYFDYRDGGQNANAFQPTAAWTSVQGSDHAEALLFTSHESLDARTNVLRGGNNSVKFNELTRSILVDVAITPWVASTNLADNTNGTGTITATTTFTNGDGVTPLSGNTNVTSSHAPDNHIAAGSLTIAASQDAEDAISFSSSPLPKWIVLGQTLGGTDTVSVRLAAGPATSALQLTGFEFLRDNGATDDVYAIDNIFKATQGSPRLTDGAANDHDTIRLATEALGSSAVGGAVGAVNLATLNGVAPGFNVDFDVLDLSAVSATGLLVTGTAGTDDELVAGPLGTLGAVAQFESLVLTNSSTDKGTGLTLDLDAGVVKAGATTLFAYGGSVISAGGLVYNTAGQVSAVTPMTTGLNITVADTTAGAGGTVWGGSAADLLTGGAGNDTLRGGGGNDTLNGGAPAGNASFAESWTFTVTGTPDAVAAAGNRISIAMTIDGTGLTLAEAAVVDTAYGDGNGAFTDGSATATIGTAMAALINANLATINAGPGTGTLTGATFNAGSGQVVLTFAAGVNANDVVTFVLTNGAGPDGGNFSLSAGVNVNGGNGGNDSFVFEKTGALNGSDLINNFTAASDKLDVSAFAGAAINAASASINATTGGTFAGVATTAEFIYNKPLGQISTADFATTASAGKFALPEGTRCVVAVTADPTGSLGDASNTPVTLYYVENGAAAGLGDLTVSLVGTISGPVELTLGQIYTALT